MGVDGSTADYHLWRLVKAQKVQRERAGGQNVHFLADHEADARERALALLSPSARRVVAVLEHTGHALRVADVAARLGEPRARVQHAISLARRVGLVRQRGFALYEART